MAFALSRAGRRSSVRFAAAAHGDDETRRKGLEAGADGYVVKSGFDQFALLEHVQKALGHR